MVYQGRDWKRTVITFNDIFFADPAISADQFEPHLRRLGQNQIRLAEEDLDRLSTYFRELQEYVSIDDAITEANPGDIILYDGSFDVFEPLRAALSRVFERAEEKGVALLAVAKSSSLYWGEGISLHLLEYGAGLYRANLDDCRIIRISRISDRAPGANGFQIQSG